METHYMAKNQEMAQKLNQLGLKYHAEVQKGYSLTPDARSDRQVEIAQEVIQNSYRLLYYIARKMIYGKGFEMPSPSRKHLLRIKDQRLQYHSNFYVRNFRRIKPVEGIFNLEDLINEAAAGIIEKLPNYNPTKGSMTTFIGYQAAAIIYREAQEKLGLVHIPVWKLDQAKKHLRQAGCPQNKSHRYGIIKNLRDLPGTSLGTASLIYLALTGDYAPLDEPAASHSSKGHSPSAMEKLEAKIKDETINDPDDALHRDLLKKAVKGVLDTLTPREKEVLELRFGIGRDDDKTLEEVGSEMNLTRERVRQIEAKALRRLRNANRAKLLEQYYTK